MIKWLLPHSDDYYRRMVEILANGDAIQDEDLDRLIEFYQMMENGLRVLGPHYHHAWFAAFERLRTLNGFKQARKARDKY